MKILIAIETLLLGGAESFILRMAEELSKDHDVSVFVLHGDKINQNLLNKYKSTNINFILFDPGLAFVMDKIDSLLFKLKIDKSLRVLLANGFLKKVIKSRKIEVVHSNLFKVDYFITKALSDLDVRIVNTIHGDYIKFSEANSVLNYKDKAKYILSRVNKTVCISNVQMNFFKKNFDIDHSKLVKIYNGYKPATLQKNNLRKQLGIKDEDFVFGLVSRGIPEKGWAAAIEAFLKLEFHNTYLILVGSSEYLTGLKEQYKHDQRIIFTGEASEPLLYIDIFDVGLLPSVYLSESLPTVVIEYLCLAKPVIASEMGEIRNMLVDDDKAAGVILSVTNGSIDTGDLCVKMGQYICNESLYQLHSERAKEAFNKFNMDECVKNYIKAYSIEV